MKRSQWYVITGGPSSGKTTLLTELQQLGYATREEAARLVIDEELASGSTIQQIRADEKAFQQAVLRRKVLVESQHNPEVLTFFDRGMHDTIAYYQSYGWDIDQEIQQSVKEAEYAAIFLLETLPFFEQDYARTESLEFTQQLRSLLRAAYENHGLLVIDVPVASPKERTQFILDKVNELSEGSE